MNHGFIYNSDNSGNKTVAETQPT